MRVAVLCLAALCACKQDKIEVSPGGPEDYNQGKLQAAVDKYVAAGRTPVAYAELSQAVSELRPGMDRAVAELAELKLVVLALPAIKSVASKPIDDQVQALALTVWPTILGKAIREDRLLEVRDPKAHELPPKPGEDVAQYLERLCGNVLAGECKRVVTEHQGQVVFALANQRGMERVRAAVGDCLACDTDPGWAQAVGEWEQLDRASSEWIGDVLRKADPDNWPIAGAASEDDPELPEAELTPRGDIVVDEHSYGPNQQRIAVLRELRGSNDVIAMHMHPDTTLQQARSLLIDARKSGAPKVAVIAREPVYPWRRRAYWIADGFGMRASLRPTDSLQLLLHAIDEVAGPGTVARVD